jgi:RecB family exonuclease
MRRLKKPTLTPSKLTTYLACPSKYRWTFVDDRGHWYRKERSSYSFGTTLHTVLERFHADAEIGVPTVEESIAVMEENWIDAGYANAEEMAEAFGEGQAMVERYIEEMRALPKVGKTLFLEKTLHLDFESFRLVGRLDRVAEREDGSLEIIDYKTGREKVTEDDVKFDVAMGCYQLLMNKEYPGRQISATLWALKSGERATYRMSPEEQNDFHDTINALGEEILRINYNLLTPRPKALCERCEFLKLCQRQPGYND